MSQTIFSTIDPTISGTTLATTLNDFKDALMSGCSGTSRPTETDIGGSWVDMTNDPTSWSFKIWTGTTDVEIFQINLTTGLASVSLATDSFQVKKISADAVGAVMELVKRRIATNGQVLDGDVVGEIRVVGRTDSSGNPVVAKIIWNATDDQTSSAYGGELSFWSTPDGSATLTEHMKFVGGEVETIVPHKLNSQILVGQNVATTATIAQLSATKVVVEMTGSTATDIQGINISHDSKVVTIHNRSTAYVTIKHQDTGAAATERIILPSAADYSLKPESSMTLFYCTTDSRWKALSTADRVAGATSETLYILNKSWTAPVGVSSVKVHSYRGIVGVSKEKTGMVDVFGNAYSWGLNTNGQIGDASIVAKSSPVAVLGGLAFNKIYGTTVSATVMNSYGIAANGSVYSWGVNGNGQLGVGTVAAKSSPVAILGGIKFMDIYPRDTSVLGISSDNSAYAWGVNTNGQLGVGNVVPRSSPVAVLGGLSFSTMSFISGSAANGSVVAVTTGGLAYSWGNNVNGQLGDGTVAAKSSPVAVLGGLQIKQIVGGAVSSRYSFTALDNSGNAYSWGDNSSGQLGHGDVVAKSSPVAVIGGLTFERLIKCPKSESIFGIVSGGSLYAWGDNTQGALGIGSTSAASSPVAVLGGLEFKDVKTFRSMSIGLTNDGTAYAWGINANGQLGLGDIVSRSSPVAVLGGFKFADIFFADSANDVYSVFGIATNGGLYAWGNNTNGTLGVGDVAPRSSPVAVLGGFAPDGREFITSLDIPVTAGNSYTISLGDGLAFFGNSPIGKNVYKVELEYFT